MKYTIIIFIILTFGFAFFGKAQVIDKYISDSDELTTVYEKNPDASDEDVLTSLDKGNFGLGFTETVYIKDYSHKAETAASLQKEGIRNVQTTVNFNLENVVVDDTEYLSNSNNIALQNEPQIQTNIAFKKENRNNKDYSLKKIEARRKIITQRKALVAKRANDRRLQAEKRAVSIEAVAEKKVARPERFPVGEKVKKKRKRAPRWNADRRGKRSVFKCFRF